MKQPEALRLADALENLEATGWGGDSFALTEYSEQQATFAAKELRRLHEANQAMLEALHWIDKRCPTPFVNEALHGMHREMAHDAGACARAAIAKATGEK